MADYPFQEVEQKWQDIWEKEKTYETTVDPNKPKYYVLDMFPYPSGAGLHVGHPLGYIASDIVARYKRIKGFNVLHPMGFDSFGLPAEQYAIQTGQHPAVTTDVNIKRYKEQLKRIGFSFDWSKEVRTSNPDYYKWTQWIFLQLFDSWYNKKTDKAESISSLVRILETEGNANVSASCDDDVKVFSATDWNIKTDKDQQDILLQYRLTYLADLMVNWCPQLGTVLANEEVKDGVSERGGYPVERKKMRQWVMRISAYSERLLQGIDTIDWPEPMKEMQRNWIGKSYGAELRFEVVNKIANSNIPSHLTVFTTRVDTTFGVTYVSIAPEHEWIPLLTAPEFNDQVQAYVLQAKNRSERDRMTDVKTVSGQFTGTYVINPFTNKEVPLYIADYVLAGYGTGIVMAVPSSDERDFRFATHFGLPIVAVQEGAHTDITQEGFDPKGGTMINSEFLNGLSVSEAIQKAIAFVEAKGIGKGKLNYRMRDAIFSRQRYWGEPIPIQYNDGIATPLKTSELPLLLPEIDKYQPTETGEPPLGRAVDFAAKNYELNTMPGWAGSSWYFLRYMDANNDKELVSKEAEKYWNQVDLYLGGAEHATGHLLYSRFWNMFLYDLGLVSHSEPFKKLINQGMIQGRSEYIYLKKNGKDIRYYRDGRDYLLKGLRNIYVSGKIIDNSSHPNYIKKHIDISLVNTNIKENNHAIVDVQNLILNWSEYKDSIFVCESGYWQDGEFERFETSTSDDKLFYSSSEVEKMSKSKYNVVNPDDVVAQYGADTLRMYEMFLGPLEQFKPWNTHGIDGVYRFIRKLWRLFYDEQGKLLLTDEEPSKEALKILHKTIKKVEEDVEHFSFNTSVSTFMICVNTLQELKCHNRSVLHDFIIALSPYAPHITEELWHTAFGNTTSISKATFPAFNAAHLVESEFEYPVSINGKMRIKINLPFSLSKEQVEHEVLANEAVQKWLEGKPPKKVIVVPNKIVNLVV